MALLLSGATFAVRLLERGRIARANGTRLVQVIESTFVAQNVTVHVLRAGERYYLVGAGSAGVTHIAELDAAAVAQFIETQRAALGVQRQAVAGLLRRIWRRSRAE